jgi:hypothetical protein
MRALGLVFLCSVVNAAVCFGAARCGDASGDAADIAAARAQVDTACVCGAASSRSAYQRCVSGVLAQRTATGLLRRQCAGSVRRCASKSVCGRPGAVTCCRSTHGQPICSIRSSAASCQTTTTTTMPGSSPDCIGGVFPTCGGVCPIGETCQAMRLTGDVNLTYCMCVNASGSCVHPPGPGLCASGPCPPGDACTVNFAGGTFACSCMP